MVTPRFPPELGGVERHVEEVARRLAPACRLTVLCTDRSGQLSPAEEREGYSIRRFRAWPATRDYYFAPGLYREVARRPWDLVHVQSYHTLVAPLAMFAALRQRVPYVVTFHGGGHSSSVRHTLRRQQQHLLRPLLARANRLVATARFEVELYGRELDIPQERFAFIPNGGDLTALQRAAPAGSDGCLIASVGRLERYKGHQRVIAALPGILRQRPDARLWVAGSGPHEQALREQARQLGVEDRVLIEAAPMADRGAMAKRLGAASLVVLLSDFETHPMAAMEALALGRPLLVADNSGLRELAEDGLARAIPTNSDPDTVARAILQELERPRSVAEVSLPSWDDCAAALLTLYRDVTGVSDCGS
jgi:glycosyltransferase involved in cell wall biosynthesis